MHRTFQQTGLPTNGWRWFAMPQRPAVSDVPGAMPFATSSSGIVLYNRRHQINDQDTQCAVGILNRILAYELAGVVRYMPYSLMIHGYNRIPIDRLLRYLSLSMRNETLSQQQMLSLESPESQLTA